MKVFRVKTEINNYQLLLPVLDSDAVYSRLEFDGTSKKAVWEPVEFYIDNPLQKMGNFFSLIGSAALICDQVAVDKLNQVIYLGVELLPALLEDGRSLFILNIIDCVNALDQKKSRFDAYDDGTRGRVLEYAFYKNRFHESTIFKIPETVSAEVLTYSGVKSPEDEFYHVYKNSGLVGLEFEELYSDEGNESK